MLVRLVQPTKASAISKKLAAIQTEMTANLKAMEETKVKRQQQLSAKDDALAKLQQERTAIVDSFEQEMAGLKSTMEKLETVTATLDTQLLSIHAPAAKTTARRWQAAKTDPLQALASDEGFDAIHQLFANLVAHGEQHAKTVWCSFLQTFSTNVAKSCHNVETGLDEEVLFTLPDLFEDNPMPELFAANGTLAPRAKGGVKKPAFAKSAKKNAMHNNSDAGDQDTMLDPNAAAWEMEGLFSDL